MHIPSLLIWLGLLFLLAKIVNHFAKRPLVNPWVWLAASYGIFYIFGLFVGFARSTPDLAYIAGSFLPITILAVALGIWRAPKWQAAELKLRDERMAEEEGCGG